MRKPGALLLRLSVILMCLSGVSSRAHFVARAPLAVGATPLLIVANQGDKNLSVVDALSNQKIATISEDLTDVWGHEVAASPDGRFAYLPIYGSSGVGHPGLDGHEMLVIDIASRKIADRIDFGRGVRPHCVVYDPVSKMLYVTTELANSVTIVDPATLKIAGEIPTTQPQSHMLAISHDGRRGYTANVSPGSVSVLDMAARKTIAVIPISANTQRIAISRDDKLVFTADQTKPQLAVIDTSTDKIKTWIALPALGYGAAATIDGHWLLIATQANEPGKSNVAVIDLATLTVARSIPVPGLPQEILVSPDGKSAYVSCMVTVKAGNDPEKHIGQVAVIDLAQWKVKSLITAGAGADGLAWALPPRIASDAFVPFQFCAPLTTGAASLSIFPAFAPSPILFRIPAAA
jgi:DNA-binding beta-propeller fold protein YncE